MLSTHLINNVEKLLLARARGDFGIVELYKVDLKHGAVRKINSICNRAIFLGPRRSISFKPDKFLGIEENSIYMENWWNSSHAYRLYRINIHPDRELWFPR